jgi:TRAP-type C4-dicarboxylate transport system substrate-binding protein
VVKASKGRIKFEYHPGGEPVLSDEALRGLSKGTIDILTAASTYYSGDCAIGDFMLMPKNFKTYEDLFDLLYGEVGEIMERVYLDKTKVKYLWTNPFAPEDFQIGKKAKKIRHIEDFKGMKCRAAGPAPSKTVECLGMVPLATIAGEYYTAMQRGEIDCGLMTSYSLETYKMWEVCDQVVDPPVFNNCAVLVWVNQDKWNTIPGDLQKIMLDIPRSKEFQKREMDFLQADDERIINIAKGYGVEFYVLPPEDQAKMWAAVAPVWDWYVEVNEKQGYGAEAKEIREIMAKRFGA